MNVCKIHLWPNRQMKPQAISVRSKCTTKTAKKNGRKPHQNTGLQIRGVNLTSHEVTKKARYRWEVRCTGLSSLIGPVDDVEKITSSLPFFRRGKFSLSNSPCHST